VTALQPGDLLATRTKGGFGSLMIRLGAALRDEPNLANHIAVVHHADAAGTTWCIEGRPGGVGWRNAADYLRSRWTMCNAAQPKTPAQRGQVAGGSVKLLGTAYDWQAIAHDAGSVFGLDHAWQLRWGPAGQVPGHVVCSSLAAWLYQQAGLACPPGDREVAPADWLALWIERGWSAPAR
jgi:hypothetical protein